MTSIDNSGIINICGTCGCAGFAPAISLIYTPSIPNIILKDLSTYGDPGDSAKAAIIQITNNKGDVAYGKIANTGSGATFGTVTFTASGPVLTVPVSAGGTGYLDGGSGFLNITFAGGAGTGAAARATVVNGVVTAVVVTAGGTGYTSAPTPTLVVNSAVITLTTAFISGDINVHVTIVSAKGCIADVYQYSIPNTATYSNTIGDAADEVDKEISIESE